MSKDDWDQDDNWDYDAMHYNHDPVAGKITPNLSGACNKFLGDGRSNICLSCDWPETSHPSPMAYAGDDFSKTLQKVLDERAAKEIYGYTERIPWYKRVLRKKR